VLESIANLHRFIVQIENVLLVCFVPNAACNLGTTELLGHKLLEIVSVIKLGAILQDYNLLLSVKLL